MNRPQAPIHRACLSSVDFDTTPGAPSALAPSLAFLGDEETYREEMRERYRSDPEVRTCILLAAIRPLRSNNILTNQFRGPYSDWAKKLIEETTDKLHKSFKEG